MIPAAYDVHERVRAMDEDGVWAELLFPTFPRFGGTQFLQADDKDLGLAMVRAWNDWMLDEWCAAYPERFIPQTLDPALGRAGRGRRDRARARRRVPARCCSSRTRTRSGCRRSRPAIGARCSRRATTTGLPLSMHIGTSMGLIRPSPETTPSVGIALCGINSMSALGDLIFSGAFNGLPNCRVALSEGGAGWVPYVLERLDYTWERSRYEGLREHRAAVGGLRGAHLGVHDLRPVRDPEP